MIDFVKEVQDAKLRKEIKEQREMRNAEIAELDARHDSIIRELQHIDDQMISLRDQRLEARAKLHDIVDRYGEVMELLHES